MILTEGEADLQQLKVQLIPNLHNLDPQVQKQVLHILANIMSLQCDRNKLSLMARLGLLQETPLLKSHIWKMLLGTLQMNPYKWKEAYHRNQQLYNALRQKFCPFQVNQEGCLGLEFQGFDKELWNQITLDTKRTHSTINFFQTEIHFTKVYSHKATKHNDVLSRILYVWGKTNSAVRYVQGMNEILAPLYYLEFQSLQIIHWDRESQIFAMFSSIMSFVIDMHIKQMDDCQNGIMGRMIFLNRYLRVVDSALWHKMEREKIYPQCYSFRWLALLLSQQFGLYDTIRLWDYILSYHEDTRFFFVYSLCISILQLRKKIIMENDFMSSLPTIQKLKDLDIQKILQVGEDLFQNYRHVNINQQFQKLIQKDSKQSKLRLRLGKAQEIHLKSGSWSYADILKHTTSYLTKLTGFNSR